MPASHNGVTLLRPLREPRESRRSAGSVGTGGGCGGRLGGMRGLSCLNLLPIWSSCHSHSRLELSFIQGFFLHLCPRVSCSIPLGNVKPELQARNNGWRARKEEHDLWLCFKTHNATLKAVQTQWFFLLNIFSLFTSSFAANLTHPKAEQSFLT